jgi:hypothetical protein
VSTNVHLKTPVPIDQSNLTKSSDSKMPRYRDIMYLDDNLSKKVMVKDSLKALKPENHGTCMTKVYS